MKENICVFNVIKEASYITEKEMDYLISNF